MNSAWVDQLLNSFEQTPIVSQLTCRAKPRLAPCSTHMSMVVSSVSAVQLATKSGATLLTGCLRKD